MDQQIRSNRLAFDVTHRLVLSIAIPMTFGFLTTPLLGLTDTAVVGQLGVAEALAVPGSDLRLFGKPESFVKRRMGVALARGADADEARARARLVASRVTPVAWAG